MQLVPLSPGGRVAAVATASLPPGPLQVALRVSGEAVVIEALGPLGPTQVGRLSVADSAAYRPVLVRLAARGHTGTCPALVGPHRRRRDPHPASRPARHLRAARSALRRAGRPSAADPGRPRADGPARRGRSGGPLSCAAPTPPRHRPAPAPAPDGTIDRAEERGAAPAAVRTAPPILAAGPPTRPVRATRRPAPRLTRSQRRRVLWVTAGLAGVLLLVSLMQSSTATSARPAAATAPVTCRPDGTASCPDARP